MGTTRLKACNIVDFLMERSSEPMDHNWLRSRLAYGSYVCPTRQVLYLETPKAACSTMKWILADLKGKSPVMRPGVNETSLAMSIHDRSQHPMANLTTVPFEIAQMALTSSEWTRFCVVRNPYARLFSAWAEKIRELSPRFRPIVQDILDWDPRSAECVSVSFSSFLHYLISSASKQVQNDAHFLPMSKLLLPDLINYTHILRLEEFPDEFGAVIARIAPEANAQTLLANHRVNTSLPLVWQDAYDKETAEAAREIAGDDFRVFGYDADSWRLQPLEPLDHLYFQAVALSAVQCRNELIDTLWSRIKTLESVVSENEALSVASSQELLKADKCSA